MKGKLGYYAASRGSKDPPSFVGRFEDSAASIGIVIAAFGTFAAKRLGLPALDGVASILIGVAEHGGMQAALLDQQYGCLGRGQYALHYRAQQHVGYGATALGAQHDQVEAAGFCAGHDFLRHVAGA